MVKAWLIILISLPDFEKDFAYFLKIMGYLIYNSRFNSFFLLVINIEVAKPATSFLAFWDTCWHNRLFIIDIAPDMTLIFCFVFFSNFYVIDPNSLVDSLLVTFIFVFF